MMIRCFLHSTFEIMFIILTWCNSNIGTQESYEVKTKLKREIWKAKMGKLTIIKRVALEGVGVKFPDQRKPENRIEDVILCYLSAFEKIACNNIFERLDYLQKILTN